MGCANTSAAGDAADAAAAVIVVAIAAAIWPTIAGAMQSEQNELRSEKMGNRRRASCAVCCDGKNQATHTHMYRHTCTTHVQTHKSDHHLSSPAGSRFSLEPTVDCRHELRASK